MAYISQMDLAKIVNALDAEPNPLVRASLAGNYVDALDACDGKIPEPRKHYERAYFAYTAIISQLNTEDKELIKVMKKRADYCREKAGLPRKD